MSRCTPHTLQKRPKTHLSCHPSVTVSASTSRGVAGRSPSVNEPHYTGVSHLHCHMLCYTVPVSTHSLSSPAMPDQHQISRGVDVDLQDRAKTEASINGKLVAHPLQNLCRTKMGSITLSHSVSASFSVATLHCCGCGAALHWTTKMNGR